VCCLCFQDSRYDESRKGKGWKETPEEWLIKQFEACIYLPQYLSQETPPPPISEVVEGGVIPDLVGILAEPADGGIPLLLQYEALWIVTNICSGSTEHCQAAVNGGCLPPLLAHLASPSKPMQDQAVWALGNIIGDTPALKQFTINN